MKGLLIKDFELAFINSRGLWLFAAWVIIMFVYGGNETVIFYSVAICMMLVITTISYDDYDNGMTFLMTLPVSRKTYALEKYAFTILSGLGGMALSILGMILYNAVFGKALLSVECLKEAVIIFPVFFFIAVFMIPARLKFGENGRIFILVVFAACFGMAATLNTMADQGMVVLIKHCIEGISEALLMVIFYIVAVLATGISILISIHVMERKVF